MVFNRSGRYIWQYSDGAEEHKIVVCHIKKIAELSVDTITQ